MTYLLQDRPQADVTNLSRGTPALREVTLPGRPVFSVTLHDVAPATQAACERVITEVQKLGELPLSLLVVPRYHHQAVTPSFERWIETRLRAGDELVLHGFTHLDESAPRRRALDRVRRRWYTAGEGEFAAIETAAAQERLEAGRAWFARRGWPVRGFVAPAWLLGAGAWTALAHQPFAYTCTLRHLIVLDAARALPALPAWSVVYSTRAAWRRQVSRLWTSAVARRQRHRPWMRYELHPGDFAFQAIRAQIMRMIGGALDAAREPVTLGYLADQVRAAAAPERAAA